MTWVHWAQFAQGGCGVSVLGDVKNLSGHSPGQPALSGSVSAGELDQMTSRLPASTIL